MTSEKPRFAPLHSSLVIRNSTFLNELMGKSILYIVGIMGAGKSSVGSRLAELLHRRFVDLDREIEVRAGESDRELKGREREPEFRRMETDSLSRVHT